MAIAQRAYAPGTASMRDFASRFSRKRSGVRHSFSSGVFLRHQNKPYYTKNSTFQLHTSRAAGFQVSSAPISGKIFNDIGMIRSFGERTKKIEIEIPASSSLPPPTNMELNLIEKMKMGQLTSESASEVDNIESMETQLESLELDEDEAHTQSLALPPARMAKMKDVLAIPPDELTRIIKCMSEIYNKRSRDSLSPQEIRSKDTARYERMEKFLADPVFDPKTLAESEAQTLKEACGQYKTMAEYEEIVATPPHELKKIIICMSEFYKRGMGKLSPEGRSMDEINHERMERFLSDPNFDPNQLTRLEKKTLLLAVRRYNYHFGESRAESTSSEINISGSKQGLTLVQNQDPSAFVVQQASFKKVLATPPEELAVIVAHVAEVFKRTEMDDMYSECQRNAYAKIHKILTTLMSYSNLDPKSLTEAETIALQKACHYYWEYVDKQASQPTLPKPPRPQENNSNSKKSKLVTWDEILAMPADEVKRVLMFAIDHRKKKLHSINDGSIRTLEKELEAFEKDPKSFGKKKQLIIEAVRFYQKHASSIRTSQHKDSNSRESKHLALDEILAMPADEVKHALTFAIDQKKKLHNEEIGCQIHSTIEGSIKRLENVLHTFEKDPKSLGERYRATISYAVRIYQDHAKRKDVHENHSGIPHPDKFVNRGNATERNNESNVC